MKHHSTPQRHSDKKAYILTGPTSGIGLATAFELAKHGTLVLVGRNREKLSALRTELDRKDRKAVFVVCDLSDVASVRNAAAEILRLGLPIAGVVNNAGIMQLRPTKNSQGWDMSFATNHVGPFALTEALMPGLPDGTQVLFVVSAVEDPGRRPAVAAGFRGGRYLSAEASARGEWKPGGSSKPGYDAYATSKQALLAAALNFAREHPRLRINAVEPGFNPTTGLGGGDTGLFVRVLQRVVLPPLVPLLMPFLKILSTPKRAARVITNIVTDTTGSSGVYYDERGRPMTGSELVRSAEFGGRVASETRALLSTVPS